MDLSVSLSLCQSSENGSKLTHATPYKKKLWNSLELSNTLIVENVTVDHSGEYTCTASSGQMEKSVSAELTVFGRCTKKHHVVVDSCFDVFHVKVFHVITEISAWS